MASNKVESVLRSQSKDDIKSFSWDVLHLELATNAPTLVSILSAATKTRVARPNTKAVISTCAAVLLNHRNPKMSLLQKIISLILYAGHSSKQVCCMHAFTLL